MQTSLTVAEIIISIEEKYSMGPRENFSVGKEMMMMFLVPRVTIFSLITFSGRTELIKGNLSYNLENKFSFMIQFRQILTCK